MIAERRSIQIVICHTRHSVDRPIMVEEGGKMGLQGMATCQRIHGKVMDNVPDYHRARELADPYEQTHTANQSF